MRAAAALVEDRDRENAAAMSKVSLKAVDHRWTRWPSGARQALVSQPRGRRVGEHRALSPTEWAALRSAVLDHHSPVAWGSPGSCEHVPRSASCSRSRTGCA